MPPAGAACAGTRSTLISWMLLRLAVRAAVLVVAAHPAHKRTIRPAGGLLPVFLTAAGCEIEPVVGTQKQITAAGIGRIAVEGAVALPKEGADARQLTRPSHPV